MPGVDVYYRPGDADSLRAAEQIAADYREIYPDPNAIQILPGLMLAELEGTRAPAVLVETAYHDNTEDAQWIRENVDTIARSLSRSVAAYLGVPFVEPAGVQPREEGPPTEAEGIPDTVPAMALRGSGQPYAGPFRKRGSLSEAGTGNRFSAHRLGSRRRNRPGLGL